MGVKLADPEPPKKGLARAWELALEHKLFSGFAGSLLLVTATIIIAIAVGKGDSRPSSTDPTSPQAPVAEAPAAQPRVNPDEDEDGVLDAEDECLGEAGLEPSGCPDSDGDGVIDPLDRCPNQAAQTSDGCVPAHGITYLSDMIEQGVEYLETENVEREQVTVGGVIDPMGIRMEVGGAYRSGAFTIPTNRRFQTIRGRVGVASEPCSSGSVGHVAIRNAEGEPLWPKSGRLKEVGRDAEQFSVRIAGEDAVVLYAQAPEPKKSHCGYYTPSTEIGWIHTELIAE